MSAPSQMKIADIKEDQWWPPNVAVQIYPEKRPQVARIRMGMFSAAQLEDKAEKLWRSWNMEPMGNDGKHFYFLRKSLGDLTPRKVWLQ